MTPVSLNNLIEQLAELRETYVYQFIMGYDKGFRCQPDEVICRVRSWRVPSTGVSTPVELECVTRALWMFSLTWKLCALGFLWRIPHIGTVNY